MAGPAVNVKLECLQGVDFAETFLFFNPPTSGSKEVTDLVPVDFTGATARLMVKPSTDATGTPVFSLTTGSGLAFTSGTTTPGPALPGYNNGIIITIAKVTSLAANGGLAMVGYYDLLIDWNNGTTSMLMCGTFTIRGTATR